MSEHLAHQESDPLAIEFSLARMEAEINKQGKSIRRTQQAFVLFAAAALIIYLLALRKRNRATLPPEP